MVRELMDPLAKEKKWTLETEKPTCVRVLLGNGTRAHVDLPLYAAPDDEFLQIKEAMAKASASHGQRGLRRNAEDLGISHPHRPCSQGWHLGSLRSGPRGGVVRQEDSAAWGAVPPRLPLPEGLARSYLAVWRAEFYSADGLRCANA